MHELTQAQEEKFIDLLMEFNKELYGTDLGTIEESGFIDDDSFYNIINRIEEHLLDLNKKYFEYKRELIYMKSYEIKLLMDSDFIRRLRNIDISNIDELIVESCYSSGNDGLIPEDNWTNEFIKICDNIRGDKNE